MRTSIPITGKFDGIERNDRHIGACQGSRASEARASQSVHAASATVGEASAATASSKPVQPASPYASAKAGEFSTMPELDEPKLEARPNKRIPTVRIPVSNEVEWIEKVSIIAVGQGVCGMPLADGGAMQIAIGSAMITQAISKDAVIARARKRAHFISTDIERRRTRNTFCQAFRYYLENGYPR
ncbi:hypothetical protein [Rhizobium leguminosarum]|uniref:hypothetical protein n=1 Tax=Rhizobium leguminosarum TaxID=384 RepID=UPI003F986224